MYRDNDFEFYDDLLDDDKFYEECCNEAKNSEKNFETFLKETGKTKKQIRQEYTEFMLWLDAIKQRLCIKNMQKALFCRKVYGALKKEYSDDLARLWCMCLSEYSYFIFEKQESLSDKDYLRYRVETCAFLLYDIDRFMRRLGSESQNREKFMRLCQNISYSDDVFLEIDIDDFYMIVTDGVGLQGEFLRDNLTYVCEKVSHSKELSEIAPNVFYALLMRYPKKLTDTEGFMPKFEAVTRFKEYKIGEDNGKNQSIYIDHIAVYDVMCSYFDCCDRDLCDAGFAYMSNLCENNMLDWHEFPMIVRPLDVELGEKYFSCFPNGMDDNPAFSANEIHISDMIAFEDYYDSNLPPKARILCYVREYLSKCGDPAEEYIAMLEKNETDKCMKIIHDIIEKSEISPEFIKPEMADVVNAIIMEEVLENVSERVKVEMVGLIPYLQEMIKI